MRNIRVIAFNTIAQALRMRIAAVIILLLLILLPIMSVVMTGDGTLLGKLQSFSSYGLSLVNLLLCLFMVIISCYTLSHDIRRRYLDMIVTKPIRRYQIVLGKFIGIVLLNLFLLTAFSLIVYGLTMMMPRLLEASQKQQAEANAKFFTARQVVAPTIDEGDAKRRAESRFRALKESDRLPGSMSEIQVYQELLNQEKMADKSVTVTAVKEWNFTNLKASTDPNDILFIRYKFNASPEPYDQQVFGQWRVGDLAQLKMGVQRPQNPIYGVERTESVRDQHEFAVPANCISEEGNLTVAFYNDPSMNNCTVIFDELDLLYRVGSFEHNLFRAVLLIAIRLIFLAAAGVFLSTWLSFPVAVLAGILVYVIGLINGFIAESIAGVSELFGVFYSIIRFLLYLIPRFDGPYDPASYIVSGHVLSWTFLGSTFIITIGIQSLLLILLGVWIFHNREIAKVTV